mgnify:CR=1 FL=1
MTRVAVLSSWILLVVSIAASAQTPPALTIVNAGPRGETRYCPPQGTWVWPRAATKHRQSRTAPLRKRPENGAFAGRDRRRRQVSALPFSRCGSPSWREILYLSREREMQGTVRMTK